MSPSCDILRRLDGTDLLISGLGFGCAPIMGRVGRSKSQKALSHAFDAGINFFDVARSYGYGEAEGVLGQFLKGRREHAVIATKVGIRAAPQSWAKQTARTIVRPMIPLSRALHRFIKSQARREFQPGVFEPAEMRKSVETSLRELRTDWIDILYLHDVTLAALQDEAILETCRQFVRGGKVRYLGLATEKKETAEIIQKNPGVFKVVSVTTHLRDLRIPMACQSGIGLIGRQPFGGHDGLPGLRDYLQSEVKSLPDALGYELASLSLDEVAMLSLSLTLHHSGMTSVIASFFDLDHAKRNLHILNHPEYRADLCAALSQLRHFPS